MAGLRAKAAQDDRTWQEAPSSLAKKLSGGKWQRQPHLDLLEARLLQSPRLVVAMPPRMGKSEFTSHWFPVWYLNRWPEKRIILCGYKADFAATWGRKVRDTITEHQDVLRVRVSGNSSAANRWETTAGGGMITAGVGGPINGRAAELLIVDDRLEKQEAASKTYRERTWEWFTSTAYTRLEPVAWLSSFKPAGIEDDLSGRVLERAEEIGRARDELKLPALSEEHIHWGARWVPHCGPNAMMPSTSTAPAAKWEPAVSPLSTSSDRLPTKAASSSGNGSNTTQSALSGSTSCFNHGIARSRTPSMPTSSWVKSGAGSVLTNTCWIRPPGAWTSRPPSRPSAEMFVQMA